jgi:hypothetical protein
MGATIPRFMRPAEPLFSITASGARAEPPADGRPNTGFAPTRRASSSFALAETANTVDTISCYPGNISGSSLGARAPLSRPDQAAPK